MLVDYHMHTVLSDGDSNHPDFIKYAKKAKLSEIGFSDHICLHYPNWALKGNDINGMVHKVQQVQSYSDSELSIKFGVEMDYIQEKEQQIRKIIDDLPLDYVLGAVHYVEGLNYDTSISEYRKRDMTALYELYYQEVERMVKSGLFDIVAHFDLIKIYNLSNATIHDGIIEKTLSCIKDSGMVLEINTNGMNKPCKDFYPSKEIIKKCCEMKIPITLGSDAHKAKQVGQYFPQIVNLLKEIGYSEITGFSNRQPYSVSL